ncbi:MAG: DUF1622 domain-containing protein [Dehalococcoidales bacterium]|jgi:uncharacterized membrane protein|nr:DUF1622 domain-containing protein [Dehalococcoidales bacterium]MDX9986153.1 DUF1622 domain-containing protein [Dehalococcoidales bacterium]NLE89447.1 DUF1622 domain-containing protein [Dehalococcoidales bacterium]
MIVLEVVSWAIAIAGAAIISWGIIKGFFQFIKHEIVSFKKTSPSDYIREIRLLAGQHLLLGLEFLIGADIIRTIIEPGLEEIAILGAIVAIRTVISYFLTREMKAT